MLKSESFIRRARTDRGVALLFALGILSALMLLGIAFMGSSIFSRRIAENRSNGVESAILARSVANLVASAAMACHDSYAKTSPNELPIDYRCVFSVGEVAAHSGHDKYGEFLRGYKRGNCTDYSKLDVTSPVPYRGNDSSAQWIYVRGAVDGNNQIIGRYAYQILPSIGYGRLNLYRTLLGKFEQMRQYPGARVVEGLTPEVWSNQIPRTARWGVSTAELNFEDPEMPSRRKMPYLSALYDSFASILEVPTGLTNLYAGEAIFADKGSSLSEVEKLELLKNQKIGRAWMASTFAEGANPGFREVAPGNHARFNLSAVQNGDGSASVTESWFVDPSNPPTGTASESWYCRLVDNSKSGGVEAASIDALRNTETALQSLTHPVAFKPQLSDFEYDSDITDDDKRPGLAFLRYIGNDPGSFASLSDLRHQIAANFNDYCDSDSIPTSNIPADQWNTTNAPQYTGNEKTLYINEIAYGLVTDFKRATAGITLASAGLVWGAELIDIYGTEDETNIPAGTYKLTGGIRSGSAKITLEPTVNFSYKITVTEKDKDDPVLNVIDSISAQKLNKSDFSTAPGLNINAIMTKEVTWAPTSSEITGFVGGNAYKMGASSAIPSTAASWNFEEVLKYVVKTEKASALRPYDGKSDYTTKIEITDCKITSICPTIETFVLTPENMILNDGTNNVDYTKITTTSDAISKKEDGKQDYVFNADNYAVSYFIGGMEAKDPRQNLNANIGETGNRTDWTWDIGMICLNKSNVRINRQKNTDSESSKPSANASFGDEDAVFPAPQTATATATATMISQIKGLTGQVNSEACPEVTNPTDRDPETVTDPGWKSNTEMISTAVIRNAPMKSPWELGFIHRGVQFQTINLKKADRARINTITAKITDESTKKRTDESTKVWNSSPGTAYAEGDGGILDWIRMTEANYSDGKINLNQFGQEKTTGGLTVNKNKYRYQAFGTTTEIKLNSDTSAKTFWEGLDKELLTALFNGVPLESAEAFVNHEPGTATSKVSLSEAATIASNLYSALNSEISDSTHLMEVRSDVLNVMDWSNQVSSEQTNDAKQEELIGRTINLLTASAEPPAVFRAVIVAQSIRDIGGIGEDVQVVSSDHPNEMDDAQIGRFDVTVDSSNDPRNNIHYDIITGEAKILVTYERNPVTGKVMIRDIENIE